MNVIPLSEPDIGGSSVALPAIGDPWTSTRRVSSASRSALMFRNVERSIARGEAWLGRRTLLGAVSQIPNRHQECHVDLYRHVIRSRPWPHENRPTSLPVFLKEYERAAMAYVRVGFEAFDYLINGASPDLELIYRRVEASEALRGQFGKRSLTGLDARLDAYVEELFLLLEDPLGPDAGEALNLLGTPIEPHITAEAALVEEFSALRLLFPIPPRAEELLTVGNMAAERLWTFLRRHTRWDLSVVHRYYDWFSDQQFEDQLHLCRTIRRRTATARSQLIAELAGTQPADWFARVIDLSTGLTLLNHVNLALEPCFSFKGGVGLGQGLIFQLAADRGLLPTEDLDLVAAHKWRLFEWSDQPLLGKAIA